MWAAKATDYRDTFDALKNYFNEPKTGELKVLKRFIASFIDDTPRQTPLDLNIYSVHPSWQINTINEYKIVCDFDAFYGNDFEILNQTKPHSVMLAEGSDISVDWKRVSF